MADKKYQVLFYGEIAPGENAEIVKKRLARAFKTDIKKIEALFSGKKRVIKKDSSREVCEKTSTLFKAAGAVCVVVPQSEPKETDPRALWRIEADFKSDDDTVDTNASPLKALPATAPPAGRVNKTVLLLLTFFLGFLGVHKHYLGRYFQGSLYLLFCWTGIPIIIALFEFFIFAFTSEEGLNEEFYPGSTPLVIILAIFSPLIGLALTTLVTTIIFYNVLTGPL